VKKRAIGAQITKKRERGKKRGGEIAKKKAKGPCGNI